MITPALRPLNLPRPQLASTTPRKCRPPTPHHIRDALHLHPLRLRTPAQIDSRYVSAGNTEPKSARKRGPPPPCQGRLASAPTACAHTSAKIEPIGSVFGCPKPAYHHVALACSGSSRIHFPRVCACQNEDRAPAAWFSTGSRMLCPAPHPAASRTHQPPPPPCHLG
jgi:hypothetical protein